MFAFVQSRLLTENASGSISWLAESIPLDSTPCGSLRLEFPLIEAVRQRLQDLRGDEEIRLL